jgi:hypothetical protein
MKRFLKLCIHINEYEHALFSAQAKAECRSITAFIKYTAMQYCKAYPARIEPKKIFVKYKAPDEVYHNL